MEKIKCIACSILLNTAGILIYAVGISSFASPNEIAPGGASGIAILINYMTGCPIGLFVFLFNIPFLLVIVWKRYFSFVFVCSTLLSTAGLSVITDMMSALHFPIYDGNPLLASMFSGAMLGTGLALVHLGRSNTGGISLAGLILQKCSPQFQVGKVISALNFVVVIASVFVYRNIDSLLYAVITVYISGVFMDRILADAEAKSLLIVIAQSTDKVRQVFLDEGEGVTVLKGEGGYSNRRQRVVMCVTGKRESGKLQEKIRNADDNALVIVMEVQHVTGKQFARII
ncbi:YitT family protein [Mediterraneibacter glycyrrhizinilyticus]|uniref:YitT family protein n=1 Tax=Mediterraneibacter glycyrrhizinilyticus TaxID=342942 RepID=UPI001961EBFD|nr:YitT family protein [Mediterraneibacter glycyrrhizinilyticus]MBM6752049.1 YitT family protein [Mediterraneibacter glycyrrhizinilyticus]HIV94007.1 YitT family protein [Candidatus Sellimonas avistercoris]